MADQIAFLPERVLTPAAMPGASYRVRFYESGTTTAKTVYTTAALSVAHPSPLLCDATGTFPAVFSPGGAIKAVITNADESGAITLDPVFRVPTSVSGASDITFSPTVPLPFTNVQAAIEGAAASAASGFTPFGLGVTGTNALIANLDATGTASGSYRFDNTTTGTYPTGIAAVDTGTVQIWRENAGDAIMFLQSGAADRQFTRRLASSAWGAWREVITVNQPLARGDIIRRGATALERLALGTSGQVLTSDGTDVVYGGVLSTGTVNTTTGGTAVAFTIPASAKKITMSLSGVSLSGSDNYLIQLSTGGAYVTAGYSNGFGGSTYSARSGNTATSASGFVVYGASAALFVTGTISLIKHTGNTWIATHLMQGGTGTDDMVSGSGVLALAGTIDGIRLTCTGANTFDAMSANVNYF